MLIPKALPLLGSTLPNQRESRHLFMNELQVDPLQGVDSSKDEGRPAGMLLEDDRSHPREKRSQSTKGKSSRFDDEDYWWSCRRKSDRCSYILLLKKLDPALRVFVRFVDFLEAFWTIFVSENPIRIDIIILKIRPKVSTFESIKLKVKFYWKIPWRRWQFHQFG